MIEAGRAQLGEDSLARLVGDFWTRYNPDRLSWINSAQDIRSYLSAESTQQTQVGDLPWKNSTTVPKLTQLYDNLVAYYMAAMFPDDEWFVFEGSNEDAQVKANIIEIYMRSKLEDSNFQKTIGQLVSDWVMYGSCFGGVTWIEDYTKDIVSGEEVPKYIGPSAYRIAPTDCLVNPKAGSFEESSFIRRTIKSLAELGEYTEYFSEEQIKKILEMRRLPEEDMMDTIIDYNLSIDGFQTYAEYLRSGYVEILEYHGSIFDIESNKILKDRQIIVADRLFTLLNRESPSWTYKKPIVMDSWRQLPDNLYGQGPLHQLVGMQYRCDHLENAKADIFDQIIHPITVIKGDMVEDFEFGPGVQVRAGEGGDVSFISPDANALLADSQINNYHSMMEVMAGAPREMAGFRTPGEKTAFEVNALQQGADRMFLDKIHSFEENIIKPMLNMMFELVVRNFEITDTVRILDDETQIAQLVQITAEDVKTNGLIRPVGAKHYAERNKRVQELQNFISILSNPSFQPHMSATRAGEMMERELGFENYGIFRPYAGIDEQLLLQAHVEEMRGLLQAGGVDAAGQPLEAGI